MLSNALFLAIRSLVWYRGRSIIIVLCLATTLWVPITVRMLVREFQREIVQRAESTPLIVGRRGSRIDLVLHGLYFQSAPPERLTMAEVHFIQRTQLATAIPLHIRFRSQQVGSVAAPIVGTTLEYFDFRELQVREGDSLGRLGDCVLGARFAERSGLQSGDHLLSAPQNAFNLAGDYPLKMRVAGILAPSWSPDDDAVFVDIKTAWIIEGIGHGHQTLTSESGSQLLNSSGDSQALQANASVLPYTEITDENEASFHFHGDESDFPVSEVIAVPEDRRAQALLLGRYASVRREEAICVKPRQVVEELLAMVFRVEQLFRLAAVLSAAITCVLLGLVIFLSVRLREPEMTTMRRLGSAPGTIGLLVSVELCLMLITALGLSIVVATATSAVAGNWLRQFLF